MRLFFDYIQHGGIPEYYKYRKPEYLQELYDGILFRDIVARYHISNEKPLRELVYYFASNVGKEFSFSKLAALVGLNSSNTVSKYCDYLEKSYLCFFLRRYSHSLKKQIHYNKKCYLIDPALIHSIGFRVSEDKGRVLENIVFLQLKMQGLDIYFHMEKKECDFLIRKKNQIIRAIQVAVHLSEESVKQREIDGLVEAMKIYGLKEGLILTENEDDSFEVQGFMIHILPIWKWLLTGGDLERPLQTKS